MLITDGSSSSWTDDYFGQLFAEVFQKARSKIRCRHQRWMTPRRTPAIRAAKLWEESRRKRRIRKKQKWAFLRAQLCGSLILIDGNSRYRFAIWKYCCHHKNQGLGGLFIADDHYKVVPTRGFKQRVWVSWLVSDTGQVDEGCFQEHFVYCDPNTDFSGFIERQFEARTKARNVDRKTAPFPAGRMLLNVIVPSPNIYLCICFASCRSQTAKANVILPHHNNDQNESRRKVPNLIS